MLRPLVLAGIGLALTGSAQAHDYSTDDVANGRRGRNGPLGALTNADQNAIVEQRRGSASDTRPNACNVRNDERPARIVPRQQGHAADRVRGHQPDRARTGLAHDGLVVSEVGGFRAGVIS
jgi:hypothetical protein